VLRLPGARQWGGAIAETRVSASITGTATSFVAVKRNRRATAVQCLRVLQSGDPFHLAMLSELLTPVRLPEETGGRTHMTTPNRTAPDAVRSVASADGTLIAYDESGRGEPLILVDGALCSRSLGPMPKLAALLAPHFRVFTYDRRGRGDSGDTKPYAVEREIEDLDALITRAGGSASVFAISGGAILALTAAARGLAIKKLALYEAPFIVDRSRPPVSKEYWASIAQAVTTGRRTEAVKLFLKAVGAPAALVALMRLLPVWSKLKAVAHTLPYDGAIVQDHQRGEPLTASQWASVEMRTLVIAGAKSPAWMHNATHALADILPNAQRCILAGQTHNVAPKRLAPVLKQFFGDDPTRAGTGVAGCVMTASVQNFMEGHPRSQKDRG
jgi:pimeloyl-ACP methyl ester carboxylesterase